MDMDGSGFFGRQLWQLKCHFTKNDRVLLDVLVEEMQHQDAQAQARACCRFETVGWLLFDLDASCHRPPLQSSHQSPCVASVVRTTKRQETKAGAQQQNMVLKHCVFWENRTGQAR